VSTADKGVIENDHGGIRNDGAGDGDTLLLPARKRHAFLADGGVVAILEIHDGVVDRGDPRGPDDFLFAEAFLLAIKMFWEMLLEKRKGSCRTGTMLRRR
jgi:hypothetical protein